METPDKDADTETQVKVANALCAAFAKVVPGSSDYEKIERVVRALVASAEEQVRVATAKALRHRSSLPRDMALTIAKDTDLVASPFLEVTTALSDDDLIEIVRSSNSIAKMMSISRRAALSENLSDALIETGPEVVVASVVTNSGAAISNAGYGIALDRFPDTDAIQTAIIDRSALPSSVMARLLSAVSLNLRKRLIDRHGMPAAAAEAIATEARERATVGLGVGLADSELESLVASLKDQGVLSGSFLTRALCAGNVQLFGFGLAAMANQSASDVRTLLNNDSDAALESLWAEAGLDRKFTPLLLSAMHVIRQTDLESDKWDIQTYRTRILQRTLTLDKTIDSVLSVEDIESLIDVEERLRSMVKSDAA